MLKQQIPPRTDRWAATEPGSPRSIWLGIAAISADGEFAHTFRRELLLALLGQVGLALPIGVLFDPGDLAVMREAIDEGRGARRIGEDGVALLEGEVSRHHDGRLFVARRDDLKEEVGGVGTQVVKVAKGRATKKACRRY